MSKVIKVKRINSEQLRRLNSKGFVVILVDNQDNTIKELLLRAVTSRSGLTLMSKNDALTIAKLLKIKLK